MFNEMDGASARIEAARGLLKDELRLVQRLLRAHRPGGRLTAEQGANLSKSSDCSRRSPTNGRVGCLQT